MRGIILKRDILLMGLAAITLSACSMNSDEVFLEDFEEPGEEVENVVLSEEIVPCEAKENECEISNEYLTNSFLQEEIVEIPEAQETYKTPSSDIIALSKPAAAKGELAKDHQATVVNDIPKEMVLEEKGIEPVPEEVHINAEESKTEKVLYTTSALPEVIPAVEKVEEVEDAIAVENPDVRTEVVATSIPETKIPLKKIKTTITETTTKIKDKTTMDQSSSELVDKISYGENVHDWDAFTGSTLRKLLVDWAGQSGWTVVWKLDRDYHLEAGVVFRGTFMDVSSALVRSFARATPAPIATFYKGNRVLVINTQEDENER